MSSDIDVVIAWVDGSDKFHAKKREKYSTNQNRIKKLKGGGDNKRRWEDNNEIELCLLSIERNAPWVRKVWIVTDNQKPTLFGLDEEFNKKIEVVDHKEVFEGYERYLPTFNSLSIETVLWRIKGLADKFVYFNDDSFITQPLAPEAFFYKDKPVVRGEWADLSSGKISMFRGNQINSAKLFGYSSNNFFASAHVAQSFHKELLSNFYENNPEVLEENISHRFRDYSQLSSASLLAHAGIKENKVILKTKGDWKNVSVKVCKSGDEEAIKKGLNQLRDKKNLLGCVNDLSAAEKTVPGVFRFIKKTITM